MAAEARWWVYLVRCGDDSLYAGVTTDLAARLEAHARGRGARYTRSRGVKALVWAMEADSRSEALSLEARLKRQPTAFKRRLATQRAALPPPNPGSTKTA